MARGFICKWIHPRQELCHEEQEKAHDPDIPVESRALASHEMREIAAI
jgi:hypothetical protein